MTSLDLLRQEMPVAYFSMELALRPEIPTYSGGLGVLAGDMVRTAADLGIPFIAITQLSRKGYFRQVLEGGAQREEPDAWRPEDHLELLPTRAEVSIEGRPVLVQAWTTDCSPVLGHPVPVLFLDTSLPENRPEDRDITDVLYGNGPEYRLKQEIVLGLGGARLLDALGIQVRKYHINEGHSALLALWLLSRASGATLEERLREVRRRCVFTTHTPVEAGQDKFPYDLVRRTLGEVIPIDDLTRIAGDDRMNMTMLALNTSGYVNGVAERHREVSLAMFPGHKISAITNGVHAHTWVAPPLSEVLDARLPGWALEPVLLARADTIPESEIWEAHQHAKRDLLALVRESTGVELDEEALTLGFARRFTPYKRPHLIFSDLSRLRRVTRRGPLQIVFAGKAHPHDGEGKRLIARVHEAMRELAGAVKVAFIPDYDMAIAKKLVSGVDVWLNTPEPPLEASGTSGMKAALNGVLNFSVLDGWWIEGHHEGITGWAIGPAPHEDITPTARAQQEIDDLYGKLEYVILPMYYEQREQWMRIMRESIDDLAPYFNSHRVMRRYVTDAYFKLGG